MRLLLFLLMTVTSMVTWGEDSIYHYGESKRPAVFDMTAGLVVLSIRNY